MAVDRHEPEVVGVAIDQPIRTCWAIRDAQGRLTELLEPGPLVWRRNLGLRGLQALPVSFQSKNEAAARSVS